MNRIRHAARYGCAPRAASGKCPTCGRGREIDIEPADPAWLITAGIATGGWGD